MLDSNEKYAFLLWESAQQYLTRGWSVIPVYGAKKPEIAKLPPIKWARFQRVRPTMADLEAWFRNSETTGGLAVICGRISQLAVLDFDDSALAQQFAEQFPDLIQTYTVQSGGRGLPHYYWQTPPGLDVPSRSAPGADLRGDGAYVIAPPTQVNGGQWRLVNDSQPRKLEKRDLDRIWRFLASIPRKRPENALQGHSGAIPGHYGQRLYPDETLLTGDGLIRCYQARVASGRNQALFDVAILARDHGWAEPSVRSCLAALHAVQEAPCGHQAETAEKRYLEAVRTISSAFSRPPRLRNSETTTPKPVGLPNAVRETLLQQGLAAAARVLDGLYLAGINAGEHLTESRICQLVKTARIGRRAVMTAIKTQVGRGQRLFRIVKSTTLAKNTTTDTPQCGLNRAANRVKNSKRGRNPCFYILPSAEEVAAMLGVTATGGDSVEADDLRHPAHYRQALHRELLRRRPGVYPRRWLAERLGVSEETCRRYEQQLEVQTQPTYQAQRVKAATLAIIPDTQGYTLPGTFLEDQDGRRYPPLRELAKQLIRQGKKIVYKRQGFNYYRAQPENRADETLLRDFGIPKLAALPVQRTSSTLAPATAAPEAAPYAANPRSESSPGSGFGIPKPDNRTKNQRKGAAGTEAAGLSQPAYRVDGIQEIHTSGAASDFGIPKLPQPEAQAADNRSFWLCPHCLHFHIRENPPERCARCGSEARWQRIPEPLWRDPEAHKRWWQQLWADHHPTPNKPRQLRLPVGRPLADSTQEARAVQMQERIPGLSLVNARRLITTYPVEAIEKALQTLSARRNIRNPAGFLVTLLRSEHLFSSRAVGLRPHRARPGEDAKTWIEKMAQSPYVSFLANADEFDQNSQTGADT